MEREFGALGNGLDNRFESIEKEFKNINDIVSVTYQRLGALSHTVEEQIARIGMLEESFKKADLLQPKGNYQIKAPPTKFNVGDWVYAIMFNEFILLAQIERVDCSYMSPVYSLSKGYAFDEADLYPTLVEAKEELLKQQKEK